MSLSMTVRISKGYNIFQLAKISTERPVNRQEIDRNLSAMYSSVIKKQILP